MSAAKLSWADMAKSSASKKPSPELTPTAEKDLTADRPNSFTVDPAAPTASSSNTVTTESQTAQVEHVAITTTPATADSPATTEKQDASEKLASTPSPAPTSTAAPPVNVWAIRKEKMAQAAAEKGLSKSTGSVHSTGLPAQPQAKASANKTSQTTKRGTGSGIAPSKNRNNAKPSTNPGSAVAVGVQTSSTTNAPASPASQASVLSPDISSWPLPVEDKDSTPSAIPKSRTASIESEPELSSTGLGNGSKKKAKWIPVPVDITIKSGISGRRNSPARMSDNQKRQPSSEGRSRKQTSNRNSLILDPLAPAELPSTRRREPSSGASSQHSQRLGASQGPDSMPEAGATEMQPTKAPTEPEANGAATDPSVSANEQKDTSFESRPFRPREAQPRNPTSGRGGRGAFRNNGSYPRQMNGYATSSQHAFATSPPHGTFYPPGGNGSDYYMQPQGPYPPYYNGYMPYGGYSGYGYPAYGYPGYPSYFGPDGTPLSPTTAAADMSFGRPQPQTSHMLMDPPLDETSFWVLGQVEYYFSEENLPRDAFLREKMDDLGWVAIAEIASFKRLASLSQDFNLIKAALLRSALLEVSGEHVRRRGDWYKWTLPSAKPSIVTTPAPSSFDPSVAQYVPAGADAQDANSLEASLDKLNMDNSRETTVVVDPVFPSDMGPHSQRTFFIGGDDNVSRNKAPSQHLAHGDQAKQ